MLQLDDEIAREIRRDPLLIELVSLFLLNTVVARDAETLAIVRLQVGIGRLGSKVVEVRNKVVVEPDSNG